MTADAYQPGGDSPWVATLLHSVGHLFGYITEIMGYIITLVFYFIILIVAMSTLALIEIRQANLKDFNALIAMLEQKDYYSNDHFESALRPLDVGISNYGTNVMAGVAYCRDATVANSSHNAPPAASAPDAAAVLPDVAPKTCAQLNSIATQDLIGLLWTQEKLVVRRANLTRYYDEYTDGLRQQTPQLIPLLSYMDTGAPSYLKAWARLPFEILEMLLLVFMGALGGVISVARCIVDTKTSNPTARDLCYRPLVGAVIALGIYVLFRAMQMFFGGVGQNSATTVSTSVFLLAALGLASGFCASDAVAQLESLARRILRRSEDGGDPASGRGESGAEKRASAADRGAPA